MRLKIVGRLEEPIRQIRERIGDEDVVQSEAHLCGVISWVIDFPAVVVHILHEDYEECM